MDKMREKFEKRIFRQKNFKNFPRKIWPKLLIEKGFTKKLSSSKKNSEERFDIISSKFFGQNFFWSNFPVEKYFLIFFPQFIQYPTLMHPSLHTHTFNEIWDHHHLRAKRCAIRETFTPKALASDSSDTHTPEHNPHNDDDGMSNDSDTQTDTRLHSGLLLVGPCLSPKGKINAF